MWPWSENRTPIGANRSLHLSPQQMQNSSRPQSYKNSSRHTSRVTKHLEPSTRWKSCLATPAANSLSTHYVTQFPNKLRTFTPLPLQIIRRGRGVLVTSNSYLWNQALFWRVQNPR